LIAFIQKSVTEMANQLSYYRNVVRVVPKAQGGGEEAGLGANHEPVAGSLFEDGWVSLPVPIVIAGEGDLVGVITEAQGRGEESILRTHHEPVTVAF
jgi:hypothetical protein